MDNSSIRIKMPRPVDADIKTRNRWSRWLDVTVTATLVVAVPTIVVGFWGSLFDFEEVGALVGFIIGGVALSKFTPARMFVYNKEWAAYVTQNLYTGKMVAYGPGLHPTHWTEQRNAEGNYSLDALSKSFKVSIATSTSMVTIEGQIDYCIDLPRIELAIGTKAAVETGIDVYVEGACISDLSKDDKSAEEIRKDIDGLTERLNQRFTGENDPLRINFGYRTVSIAIKKISLPEEVQKTKDSVAEAQTLFETVAMLHGLTIETLKGKLANGTISQAEYQKMLTRAMAISGNQTTLDVKVIEGLEDGSPQRGRSQGGRRQAAVTGAVINALQPKKGGQK